MIYNFKDKGLEIKFTWRERISLFFLGRIIMTYKESYHFSAALMSLVQTSLQKYGDAREHIHPKLPKK